MSYWLLFFSASFALCISPGPDLIYIMSKTASQGTRSGIFAAAGVCSGEIVHIFAAALGISAVLAASSSAFTIVKTAGAAYLIYLGIKAMISRGSKDAGRAAVTSHAKTFRQGVISNVLNPKVSLFFMAFLPQFVRPGMGSTPVQMIYLGFLVILTGFVTEVVLVFAASKITGIFSKGRQRAFMSRILGCVLIGLGIRLALSTRR